MRAALLHFCSSVASLSGLEGWNPSTPGELARHDCQRLVLAIGLLRRRNCDARVGLGLGCMGLLCGLPATPPAACISKKGRAWRMWGDAFFAARHFGAALLCERPATEGSALDALSEGTRRPQPRAGSAGSRLAALIAGGEIVEVAAQGGASGEHGS
jgi:hypothetical protein